MAIIGVLSYYKLSETVHGPGHILQGLFVSSFGFIALVGGVGLLAKYYPRAAETAPPADAAGHDPRARRSRLIGAAALATALLFAVAVYRPVYAASVTDGEAAPLSSLGGDWRRLPETAPARFVGDGEKLTAQVFQASGGQRVELFLGALAHAGANGTMSYRAVEFPGDVSASQVLLPVGEARTMRVNRATFIEGGRETDVVYFYDLNGRPTAQGPAAKAYALAQLFTRRDVTPRLVVVVADRAPGVRPDQGLMPRFVRDVVLALNPPVRAAEQTRAVAVP